MTSNPQTTLIAIYLVYAGTSLFLTVWLARTLFKNGAVFLDEVFSGNPKLGEAVNRLLVVGFYLLNLGYASMMLKAHSAATLVEAIEVLSAKTSSRKTSPFLNNVRASQTVRNRLMPAYTR